jgi:DNA-binding NtrC family response regulator
LWYRIAVFSIHIPPLRERPEDVPEMASHFALRAAKRFGTPARAPTQQDLDLLLAYPWPGNVRELRAVLERAVILGDGRRLEVAKALGNQPPVASAVQSSSHQSHATGESSNGAGSLDDAMSRHIGAALAKTGGRIEGAQGAAKLLGINPHTLRARMRKLGLDWKKFRKQ